MQKTKQTKTKPACLQKINSAADCKTKSCCLQILKYYIKIISVYIAS